MKKNNLITLLGSISLLLVLAALPILTACTQPAPTTAPAPTTGPAPVPSPTQAPAPSPTPAPAPVKPVEFRFAHHNPSVGWFEDNVLQPWIKKVDEATKGMVKVTSYPARTLVTENDLLIGIETGVADMGWLVESFARGRFPMSEVMSLPFSTLSEGQENGVMLYGGKINSRVSQQLYEKFPEYQAQYKTVKLLFCFVGDPSAPTTKKPVRNLEDLKGVKIRALAGLTTELYKLLGASPVPLPIPDIYEAAQKGVIDAMDAQVAQIVNYRFYEVFHYRTRADITSGTNMSVIMNLDKWNRLSPDLQNELMSVSGVYGAEWFGDGNFGAGVYAQFEEAIKKPGSEMEMVDLDPGELERWIEVGGKPVVNKWIADTEVKGLPAQKVYDELVSLMGKYK